MLMGFFKRGCVNWLGEWGWREGLGKGWRGVREGLGSVLGKGWGDALDCEQRASCKRLFPRGCVANSQDCLLCRHSEQN